MLPAPAVPESIDNPESPEFSNINWLAKELAVTDPALTDIT